MKARLHPIWVGGRDGYRYSVLFEGKRAGSTKGRRRRAINKNLYAMKVSVAGTARSARRHE
jgi:hypothetical protein